jgi:serine/threonine protein kinase
LAEAGKATVPVPPAAVPAERQGEWSDLVKTALKVREALEGLRGGREKAEEPPRIAGFRIEEELGRGGLGVVYAAWDEALERRVALKVLKRATARESRERILEEARKAARLQDPAFVTIHSVAGGECPAIVMEYLEGYPIDRASAALTFRQRAKLCQEVARALAVAHAGGLIHRDLKPENILVSPDLKPKILDFGLAISPRAGEEAGAAFEGTPLFASPEQVRGEKLTPASDVFSFGGVMFTVLAGRPPFLGESLDEIFGKILREDPPFPRSISSEVPEDLQAICLACLARDPRQRPDAGEVAADLGRHLAGEPARLRPALYRDVLGRKIGEHEVCLREWQVQGMISPSERDRLELVYRRILADEDQWILDTRKLSLPQTVLYTGTWMAIVSAIFLVWLARNDLSPLWRWALPAAGCLALLLVGVLAQRRKEYLASASFLTGAVLALVPAVLSVLGELGLLASRPPGVRQLLDPPYSNHQLLAASLAALGLSAAAWRRIRLTGFAWTTAALIAASYFGFLLTRGWLDLEIENQALALLPLVCLEGVALWCERKRRFRWALPFHLAAFVTLVVALFVMAMEGPTLRMLGLGGLVTKEEEKYFSLALNGLLYLAIMIFTERARSLDLRLASRVLEILVPLHLLGGLYAAARSRKGDPGVGLDVALYLAAVFAILCLGPWRSRKRFLLAGLVGILLGSYLLIDLDLVRKAPFILALGAAGFAAALSTYLYLGGRGLPGRPKKPGRP